MSSSWNKVFSNIGSHFVTYWLTVRRLTCNNLVKKPISSRLTIRNQQQGAAPTNPKNLHIFENKNDTDATLAWNQIRFLSALSYPFHWPRYQKIFSLFNIKGMLTPQRQANLKIPMILASTSISTNRIRRKMFTSRSLIVGCRGKSSCGTRGKSYR
jgi:hypothetical protein